MCLDGECIRTMTCMLQCVLVHNHGAEAVFQASVVIASVVAIMKERALDILVPAASMGLLVQDERIRTATCENCWSNFWPGRKEVATLCGHCLLLCFRFDSLLPCHVCSQSTRFSKYTEGVVEVITGHFGQKTWV